MMQTVRAAGTLAWRPVMLSFLYLLCLSAAAPAIILGWQLGDNVDLFSPHYVHLLVWGQVLYLMPMLGGTVNQVMSPATTKPLIFTTPQLRERLLHAQLAINVVFSLAIATTMAFVGRPQDSFAVFCCSLLFYELGRVSSNPGTPGLQQLIVWVGGIVTLVFLKHAVEFLESHRLAAAFVAIGYTTYLVAAEFSPRRARERVQNAVPAGSRVGAPFTPIFFSKEGQEVVFRGRPSSGRTMEWLRALDYEMSGARRWGTAKELGFFIVFFSIWSFVFSSTNFPAVMGILFVSTGRGLVGKFAYPIDRADRGKIVFLNGVLRYSVYFCGALLVTWIIERSKVPRLRYADLSEDINAYLALGSMFLWTPLAQWLTVKLKIDRRDMKLGTGQAKLLGMFIATMTAAVATALVLSKIHGGLPVQAGIFLLMLIAGHALLWVGLKRHFATADLV